VASVSGQTLKAVRYHFKKNLGITDDHYSHSTENPFYGTGQGSGNNSTIWLVVSSALFRSSEDRANGASFESPYPTVGIVMHRVGFVDDMCRYVNLFDTDDPPTPTTVIQLLTKDSQLWSDLLWRSGGSLELPKCTHHYSNYLFQDDGMPMLEGGQVGPAVEIQQDTQQARVTVPFR